MIDGREPAFPVEGGNNNFMQPCPGLSKREYFAGLALQGILSGDVNGVISENAAVKMAKIHADALLKELG